jgi:ATP/maltotriose-dependent transcriptional regulator MalT
MLVESSAPAAPDALALAHGRFLAQTGQIGRALAALESLPEPSHHLVAASRDAAVLDCRLARGDLAKAKDVADRISGHMSRPGLAGALAEHALGEYDSARGDIEQAALRFASAGERLTPREDDPETLPWRSGAALAQARLGRTREADRLATEHLVRARRTGSPYVVAQALRTAAATAPGAGRVALLREARGELEGVPAERLGAQIDTDLAVLLSLQGDAAATGEAIALLRGAEDYAGREDLFPLQTRIRTNLQRLGQEPRRIRSETLASLTATEQKAARMAAAGLTNREIAAAMSVTVKAVEWHLSHVYRKLGIRGRRMLPATLGAPG